MTSALIFDNPCYLCAKKIVRFEIRFLRRVLKMKIYKSVICGCTTILVVLLFFGCGGVKLDGLVMVRGIVTYKGQPLEGATIGFVPKNFKNGDRVGTGMTDARGKFELRTIGELGVLPNDYCVIVIKNIEDIDNNQTPLPNNKSPNPKQKNNPASRPSKKFKSLIPTHYNNAQNSGLNFIVGNEGLKDVKIELVD
jgi:hypothetical protein